MRNIMMASIARRVATSSLCGLSASSSSSSSSPSNTNNNNNKGSANKSGRNNNNRGHRHHGNSSSHGHGHGQPTTSTGSSSSTGVSSSGSSSTNTATMMMMMMGNSNSNSNSSPPPTTSSSSTTTSTSNRAEKVKFGIPLVDVCSVHNDLPSLLLMMILKLNKEAPHKKDIFRAPGNQANMRKLIQFLQNGRLVNLEQFSVHTIASVLKKFLRKLPNGIFGQQNERLLFDVIGAPTESEEKYLEIQRIIFSLPIVTQHLLVLLFGTFRLIVDSRQSSMTSESLSISVAPSFFHSCIPDGNKFAKLEDVQRFKIASSIMKFIIDNFGIYNLFGQENYGYYSRMTGKIINVEENWTFTFRYPPKNLVPKMKPIRECTSSPMMCSSTNNNIHLHQTNQSPVMMDSSNYSDNNEQQPIRSQSVENDPLRITGTVTMMTMINAHEQHQQQQLQRHSDHCEQPMDNLKNVNQYAESTKSLTFLPIVHERQTQRMKTRSEWFLKSRGENCQSNHSNVANIRSQNPSSSSSSSSNATTTKGLIKKSSSKEKREKVLLRRTSSKKSEKPCCNNNNNNNNNNNVQNESNAAVNNSQKSTKKINDSDCTERSIRQTTMKYTYKPAKTTTTTTTTITKT
nr:myosin-G heavy chain-like isoform X2 [Dermatophagoides farinae]